MGPQEWLEKVRPERYVRLNGSVELKETGLQPQAFFGILVEFNHLNSVICI